MTRTKTTIAACIAAATLATSVIGTATPAQAWGRGGWGGPVAVGLIGGLAAGAIIGNATRPAYGYGYGYGYAPAYGYAPVQAYSPCYRGRTPVYDAYGNFAGYRPIRVCN